MGLRVDGVGPDPDGVVWDRLVRRWEDAYLQQERIYYQIVDLAYPNRCSVVGDNLEEHGL